MAIIAIVALVGCPRDESNLPSVQTQQSQIRQAGRADALLTAAANLLSDLAAATDTEMKPPTAIVNAQKSGDRQDVLATCTPNPASPDGIVNLMRVPAGNGRFKSLGVKSGDLIKYYVRPDKTVDNDSASIGLSRAVAMDLKVAQVLDDNTLLIEGGLNGVVEYPEKIEIWRYGNTRQKEINEKLVMYDSRRRPALAWEPAPDEQAVAQVLAWLNQWIRQTNPPEGWKRDPLLESLPAEIVKSEALKPYISPTALHSVTLQPVDGRFLQEAAWLRDIGRWARGDSFDDVSRATELFDWSVRSIELMPEKGAVPHRPWHTLLYGRGTAAERAWVFAGLCRQQGLNVVMLEIPVQAKANNGKGEGSEQTYLLASLWANGQLHLFDPQLGLPVRGPEGNGVVTFEQAIKDDALLSKLDLDGAPYPVTAETLSKAEVQIVADPMELARRYAHLESAFAGDDHLVLSVKPTAIAEELKPTGLPVRLWVKPFQCLKDRLELDGDARHEEALEFEPFAVRPILWKARTRHFQGRRKALIESRGEMLDDHQEAKRLYMDKTVRPTDERIAGKASSDERRVDAKAKRNATYWLGLLSFDDGKFDVADDWFRHPELTTEDSPWREGAEYNLSRSLEAQQEFEQAIPLLEKRGAVQEHGNKLRARELKAKAEAKPKSEKDNEGDKKEVK